MAWNGMTAWWCRISMAWHGMARHAHLHTDLPRSQASASCSCSLASPQQQPTTTCCPIKSSHLSASASRSCARTRRAAASSSPFRRDSFSPSALRSSVAQHAAISAGSTLQCLTAAAASQTAQLPHRECRSQCSCASASSLSTGQLQRNSRHQATAILQHQAPSHS